MLQEGKKLPRLVIIDEEWEDDDGDVLNAKNEEPPAGIVDPKLRKMWHDFRAINKSRPDRDLELPRNLSNDDVAILSNAVARGQDSAGAQLALVMSKFFPLKDDTHQADSLNRQQYAKSTEVVVDEVEEPSRSRSSQATKVKELRPKRCQSKSVFASHQAPRCERLGEIAWEKRKEKAAITPRGIPRGRYKRAKSEVLPLMNNKRLSTPRERTTVYKMKLSPMLMPFNISLLDPPCSETHEVIQRNQTLDTDQDMAEEQAIPANDRQMDSSLVTKPNSQNPTADFEMMPRLVCYHGGIPHPFCGPLPNFMAPSPMHMLQCSNANQAIQWSNDADNFPGTQTSDPMVNEWFKNGWNTQFMPPMYASQCMSPMYASQFMPPFYQPMQIMQPHPSVHHEPPRDDNGEK